MDPPKCQDSITTLLVQKIKDFKYLQGAIKYSKSHSTCEKELLEMKNITINNKNAMDNLNRQNTVIELVNLKIKSESIIKTVRPCTTPSRSSSFF